MKITLSDCNETNSTWTSSLNLVLLICPLLALETQDGAGKMSMTKKYQIDYMKSIRMTISYFKFKI